MSGHAQHDRHAADSARGERRLPISEVERDVTGECGMDWARSRVDSRRRSCAVRGRGASVGLERRARLRAPREVPSIAAREAVARRAGPRYSARHDVARRTLRKHVGRTRGCTDDLHQLPA